MTAQVQGNQVQGSGDSGSVGNNNMMRITIGPTALASKMIYQMLTMYLKILKTQSEQKNNFYECQQTEAKSQAKATRAAAWMEAGALMVSGGMMIAGGLASIAVNMKIGRKEYATNKGKMDALEKENAPYKEINKMQPEAASQGMGANNNEMPQNIEKRITDLKAGKFLDENNAYDKEVTTKAMQHIKAVDAKEGTNEFGKMKTKLNEEIAPRSQDMNSFAQNIQAVTVSRQTYSQVASQAATAAGNFAQAPLKVLGASQQKAVELNRTAGSQAGQGASELGQDMGKEYQNAMQALQALAAIRQSAETSNM